MDKEIKELSRQRDLAQSRVEELLQSAGKNQLAQPLQNNKSNHQRSKSREKISWLDDSSVTSDATDYQRLDMDLTTSESIRYLDLTTDPSDLLENVDDSFLLNGSSPKLMSPPSPNSLHPSPGWEEMTTSGRTDEDSDDNCNEVLCIDPVKRSPPRNGKGREIFGAVENEYTKSTGQKETKESYHSQAEYNALVKRIKELQNTINCLVNRNLLEHPSPRSTEPTDGLDSRASGLSRSRSCKAAITTDPKSTCFEKVVVHQRDHSFGGFEKGMISGKAKGFPGSDNTYGKISRLGLIPTSIRACIMNEMDQEDKISSVTDSSSIYSSVAGINEDSKPITSKQMGFEMVSIVICATLLFF